MKKNKIPNWQYPFYDLKNRWLSQPPTMTATRFTQNLDLNTSNNCQPLATFSTLSILFSLVIYFILIACHQLNSFYWEKGGWQWRNHKKVEGWGAFDHIYNYIYYIYMLYNIYIIYIICNIYNICIYPLYVDIICITYNTYIFDRYKFSYLDIDIDIGI